MKTYDSSNGHEFFPDAVEFFGTDAGKLIIPSKLRLVLVFCVAIGVLPENFFTLLPNKKIKAEGFDFEIEEEYQGESEICEVRLFSASSRQSMEITVSVPTLKGATT